MTRYPTQSYYPDNQSFAYPNNAEHQARDRQVSILKSLVWLDQGSEIEQQDNKICNNKKTLLCEHIIAVHNILQQQALMEHAKFANFATIVL